MIKWRFWQRNTKPANMNIPVELKGENIKDDWAIVADEWIERRVCHCGYICNKYKYILGDICPKCGHKDKWSDKVIRYTHEYSSSRRVAGHIDYKRNHAVEVWDESKCEVKS